MQSSRSNNFSPKSEQALNQLIAAYAQAEQTYAYAAANAAEHTQVNLKNFARFFQKRAHEANTQCNRLMQYQFRRGGSVQKPQGQQFCQQYQQQQYPQQAEQMREQMKQLTAMEKQIQEAWNQFYQTAAAENDQESAQYAKRQLSSQQYPAYAQMVRLSNALQQAKCAQHFDAFFMKAEVEGANAYPNSYQAYSQQQQQQKPQQRQQQQPQPYRQQSQYPQQQQAKPYSQQYQQSQQCY